MIKRKNKFYDTHKFGLPKLRVYHKKGNIKKSPRYLIKCGDCDNKIEIYYAYDNYKKFPRSLEIGGVHGAIEDWKEILLPLLNIPI